MKGQSSIYGTEGYAPPEQYNGKSQPRSDVYALAATLYHLMTDDDPRDHPFDFPMLATLPPDLRRAIEPALDQDVNRRPDAKGFRTALEKWLDERAAAKAAKPLVLRSGTQVRSVDELADVCDARWDDARTHLYKGDFANWLGNSLHRHDLAAQANDITQRQPDQDVGLDQFIRSLDPGRLPPTPVVTPATLKLGRLSTEDQKTFTFQIANGTGRGPLKGKLVCDPPVVWLRLPGEFTGNAVTLNGTALSRGLAQGQTYKTFLRVTTPYGTETSAPVQLRVTFAWGRLLGRTALGALLGLIAGALLGYLWLPNTLQAPRDPLIIAGILGLVALLATRKRAISQRSNHATALGLFTGMVVFIVGLYLALSMLYQFATMAANRSLEQAAVRLALDGLLIGLLVGVYSGLRAAGKRLLALGAPLAILALVVLMAWGSRRFVPVQTQYAWQTVSIPVFFVFDFLNLPAPSVPKLAQLAPPAAPAPVGATAVPARTSPTDTPTPKPATGRNPTSTPVVQTGSAGSAALMLEDRVRVVTQGGARLTVRSKPGKSATVVTRVNAGTVLQIVDGPVPADGFQWWQVRGNGFTGWAAQDWLVKVP